MFFPSSQKVLLDGTILLHFKSERTGRTSPDVFLEHQISLIKVPSEYIYLTTQTPHAKLYLSSLLQTCSSYIPCLENGTSIYPHIQTRTFKSSTPPFFLPPYISNCQVCFFFPFSNPFSIQKPW